MKEVGKLNAVLGRLSGVEFLKLFLTSLFSAVNKALHTFRGKLPHLLRFIKVLYPKSRW